jgi:molybdenum cofactor guanylyltransferase
MPSSGLTGVVLCGGASRRMGVDKAEIELAGRTLLERAVAALAGACDEVLLATGGEPRYPSLGLSVVLDRVPGAGPLAGLEAGLEHARGEWVAALACDMPHADARLFERLHARARERDLDACLYEGPSGVEPLCGVYRRSCLPAVRAALDAGERRVVAFERHPTAEGRAPRVGRLSEDELEPELAARRPSANVNTPEDLARERAPLEEAS